MKAKPCRIIINNSWGYEYTPQYFPSINQAYKYGRQYLGGFWFRIFDLDGNLIRSGYCEQDTGKFQRPSA